MPLVTWVTKYNELVLIPTLFIISVVGLLVLPSFKTALPLAISETTLLQIFFPFLIIFFSDYFLGLHSYIYLLDIVVSQFYLVLLFSQSLLFLLMIPSTFRSFLSFHFIFWVLTHMANACWMLSDDTIIIHSMHSKQNLATHLSGLLLILGSQVRNLTITFDPLSLALPISSQSPNCQIYFPNISVVCSFSPSLQPLP